MIGTIRDAITGVVANVKNNVNTTNNELLVNLEGHQCPSNTTVAQLAPDAVFTGSAWQDTLDYGVLSVSVSTDVDSATDGLDIQWSNDGLTAFDHDYFTILADASKTFTFGPARRYYRVVYTNGSDDTTTTFGLTSLLRKCYVKPSSHRITDNIVGEDDAELVKAVLTGLAPDGEFKNVLVTNGGNQKISIEEFESGVSSNSNSQLNVTPFLSDGTEGAKIVGRWGSGAGETDDVRIDASTNSLQTVDYAHHEIHAGSHFFTGNYTTLSNAQVYDILFVTPAGLTAPHMIFEIATQAEAMFQYYEGVTTSADGTALDMYDRNRVTDNTPTTTFYHTPTVTAVGTLIGQGVFGSGNKGGGTLRDSSEFVLKPSTKYMIRVTNNTSIANWYDWFFDWYEHSPKH